MPSHVRRIVLLLAALALACVSFPAYAQTDWAVVATFHVGGPGGWDYLTVDSQTHRLYVPRTTHTLVIDAESGKTIADILGQKNAHGVALAPKVGRGFISDGGGNGAIVIFDLKTNVVLGSITAKEDADGIIYDSNSDQILVVTGRGKALMSFKPDIDPKDGKIDEPIPLSGEPEFLAADSTGKAYVNLMDTHQVAVVDLRTRRVIANWPVAPGGLPVGMTIDSARARLFIGCRGPQKLVVMSTSDGKVISDLLIGESVDAVKVDGAQVFASTAGGILSVQSETSPGYFAMVQSVKTGEGARTMGVDSGTHKIYLPSAAYETGANGRRSPVPGSFMILVVARQGAR